MKKDILKQLIRECLNENKNEYDEPYVTYIRQMNGEVPFMMGGKKYEYVWAKYPSGKRDIGVYSFAGDVVHGYNYFRKMYNLDGRPSDGAVVNESVSPGRKTHFFVNKTDLSLGSRDPDAEREIVYQVVKVTSDPTGDDYEEVPTGIEYYDEGRAKSVAAELNQKLAAGQIKEDVEHFSKLVKGTVSVDGVDFDYEATVSGNVVGTPQPHGEFHSEVDETSVDVEIENVTPAPTDEQWDKIDSAVYDDVMGKDLWDLVNEIQSFTMIKPEVKPEKTIDITGKKCVRCKKGTYGETSIHNDIERTKSCSSCGHTLPTNSTKNDLLKEFEGEANKNMCFRCKREILPSETRYRMPMSGLVHHMPSCPTEPPMGEKPHDRDVRVGKLKKTSNEVDTKSILSKIRSTHDFRGRNVSSVQVIDHGESEGSFLLFSGKGSPSNYFSAVVTPIDSDLKSFNVKIHYSPLLTPLKDDLRFKNLSLDKVMKVLRGYN